MREVAAELKALRLYGMVGAWEEIAPREGWLAFVKDEDALLHYDGAAWVLFAPAALVATAPAPVACAPENPRTRSPRALTGPAGRGYLRARPHRDPPGRSVPRP